MDVVERVHIAPHGFEYDRIFEPAVEGKVDRIYLLEHEGPQFRRADFHDELIEDLRETGIDVETEPCDLYDVYDVLAVVTTLAYEHRDDDVRVNVSTGREIAAVGATIGSMVTNATPYYVHPSEYSTSEEPVGRGVRDVEQLPTYPIDAPTDEQVAVLEYLQENRKVNKKELIGFGEQEELPFIENSQASTDKSKFRVLDSKIIDPLVDDGYVEVEKVGRQKRIHLTESGRNVLHGFQHLLQDGSELR
jgi:hypothetical protein